MRKAVDALAEHIAEREGVETLYSLFGSVGLTSEEMIELGWLTKE